MSRFIRTATVLIAVFATFPALAGDRETGTAPAPLTGRKAEVVKRVEDMSKLTQEIVDSQFSFAELGFQEFQTQAYLTALL